MVIIEVDEMSVPILKEIRICRRLFLINYTKMRNLLNRRELLLIISTIFIYSCSKDGDPEVAIAHAPETKPATEVAAASFVANWENVKGAKYYKLDVSKNVEFTLLVDGFSDKEVTGTSLIISGLNASEKYFYRVKAGNGLGETAYSKVMYVRSINKNSLYNILWKGDEQKSNITFLLQDLYFNSNGTYSGYFGGNVVSFGTWQWEENSDTISVQSSAGSFKLKVLDVDGSRLVAYVSALTDELLFYNK